MLRSALISYANTQSPDIIAYLTFEYIASWNSWCTSVTKYFWVKKKAHHGCVCICAEPYVIWSTQIAWTLHKKKKFSIKEFFSKYEQIHRTLQIWSHLLKKSLMENFIFHAVGVFFGLLQITIWISVKYL